MKTAHFIFIGFSVAAISACSDGGFAGTTDHFYQPDDPKPISTEVGTGGSTAADASTTGGDSATGGASSTGGSPGTGGMTWQVLIN